MFRGAVMMPRSIGDALVDPEQVNQVLDLIEAEVATHVTADVAGEITIALWRLDVVYALAVEAIRERMAADPALLAIGLRNIGIVNRRLAATGTSYVHRLIAATQ